MTSAGAPTLLLAGFVRRIDRLKAELVDPDAYARLGRRALPMTPREAALEREFAEIYRTHERMLAAARRARCGRPDPGRDLAGPAAARAGRMPSRTC